MVYIRDVKAIVMLFSMVTCLINCHVIRYGDMPNRLSSYLLSIRSIN